MLRAGKAIKVLVVVGSLDVGGTERHIVQVMPQLLRCNITPLVYTLTHAGPMAQNLILQGVEVAAPRHRWPANPGRILKGMLLMASSVRLWFFLRREKPDIVHFFLPMAYLIGGFCCLAAGCRKLVMSRRSLNHYQKNHPVLAWVEIKMHRWMIKITGNSRAVIADLAGEGVCQDRLQLIYNGLAGASSRVGATKEFVRAKLVIPAHTLVLIVVANLIPYKGHVDLLHALGMVRGQLPQSWKLLCVGRDDGLKRSLMELSHELKISDSVIFLGQRNDVADLLTAADIGLLCSHEEGFSNAVLEGMASGLPMVVTDVGGNSEAVVDGMTGMVVPPHRPDKLGAAIVSLANNLPLRQKMGRAARQRQEKEFSLNRCLQGYADLYEEIMS